MIATKKRLILAIDVKREQIENLEMLCIEGDANATFHTISSSDYLSNKEHPEPSLILLNLAQTCEESSGAIEAISESPHPIILIHPTDSCCTTWWMPTYPQLRDCLPDRDNDRISTAILREIETLELVHRLKESQFRLNNISHGLNSIISNGSEAAALIHNGQYLKANKAYRKLFSLSNNQSLQKSAIPKIFTDLEKPHSALGPPSNRRLENCSLTLQTGETFQAEILAFPLTINDKQCLQVLVRNPSISKINTELAQQLLHKDELTGLINRQYFLEQLKERTENRNHQTDGGLALILIDRFKAIREERGIFYSDQLLAKVSRLIEKHCHPDDFVSRFNDAVFAIYTSHLKAESFSNMIENIQQNIAETLFESGEEYLQITCSAGASLWNEQLSDMQELITRADQACAKAAKNGGNQIHLYSSLSTPLASAPHEQQQVVEITEALKENRFRLIYQPIVHLNGGTAESYAVLLRMIDKKGKHISPDQFIHLAEKTGLIYKLDKWVVQQTCLLIKRAQIRKNNRLFFVKLSGESLDNKNLLPHLYNCLRETGVNGQSLVFQIDYAESRTRPTILKNFILGIKKVHCQFAFDHFGFGKFKSMDLQNFPIDYLKIDGAFVRDLLIDPDHKKTVKRVISASRPLNIKTIAKSVEDANTLALLWNLGVDAVQGYFLQEPSEIMKYDFSYNDDDTI
jgi:diguanylate cyclase (GGDEF)-like protein